MKVPFFRVALSETEIAEVVDTLRSGWLTTGPKVRRFETEMAEAVGAKRGVAVNSCTAGLHLAIEALGVKRGDAVLVPAHTFAATAEVVRYLDAHPVLVDCDPVTLNMDLNAADRAIADLRAGRLPVPAEAPLRGVIPVHIGGSMLDMEAVRTFAAAHDLFVVEDAAHAFPASYKTSGGAWKRCGEGTSQATCFSFYANKTLTTGEGGMVVTDDDELADRMRLMSLHGLSRDAWDRYAGGRSWDYRIVDAGYKYNLTDIAAAIGIHQLARAEEMRLERQRLARAMIEGLRDMQELVELPADPEDRIHAWHLFPIKLHLERCGIDRNDLFDALRERGVACSVHYRPLHLHPYYEGLGWTPAHLPEATRAFSRILSLPLFVGMREDELDHVVQTLRSLLADHAR